MQFLFHSSILETILVLEIKYGAILSLSLEFTFDETFEILMNDISIKDIKGSFSSKFLNRDLQIFCHKLIFNSFK